MNRKAVMTIMVMAMALGLTTVATAHRVAWVPYRSVVQRVASMVSNQQAQRLARRHGLQILNLTWEDTGRWQGSSVGPNISDVTIEVEDNGSRYPRRSLMPVIRFPNFKDKTADVRLDRFYIRVGNEKEGRRKRVISLKELLANPTRYMSLPRNGRIKGGTLLASRDSHALVSAQAALLPVPQGKKAKFHPVIFNYQSSRRNPAVLTLLITRQGTSMTVIDNSRDTVSGRSWGQRLFFNAAGKRAPLTAERLSDVKERGTTSNGESSSTVGADANLLMLVQVPLKVRRRNRGYGYMGGVAQPAPMAKSSMRRPDSSRDDMETAVLGHGQTVGPYTELDGLTIERDSRFPVRVTVQFYQATTAGHVSSSNMKLLARQIQRVYEKGDYVGSLVVPGPGDSKRPTNWDGVRPAPGFFSWNWFPGLRERARKLPWFEPKTIGVW